jgi:hypothetical protein
MQFMRAVFAGRATLLGLCVGTVGLLLTTPAVAVGRPVTIAIEARVESVDDRTGLLCAAVAPGDIITGTYTYDLDASDSNEADFVGDYDYNTPPNGIDLELGGARTGTDPRNTNFLVELVNSAPGEGSDNYLLRSYRNVPLSCGTPVGHIAWQLDDATGEALSNTALPRTPPRLDDFEPLSELTVVGPRDSGGPPYFVRAHVISAKLVVAPSVPTAKEQCKDEGFKVFTAGFKNQGDCVSFVATQGKNEPGKNLPSPEGP